MGEENAFTRRGVLQLGVMGGVMVAAGCLTSTPAFGNTVAGSVSPTGVTVVDLGPGAVQFASKSAVQIGETIYIGSRNLEPTYVVAFHIPTRTVTGKVGVPGRSIEGIDLDAEGRYLYFATQQPGTGKPDLYRWDLHDPASAAEPLGSSGTPVVWALSTAPDDVSYYGGNEAPPRLREYDPATRAVTDLGIVADTATGIRTILATDTTVFVGSGTVVHGGPQTARAVLRAYDRDTREFRDILPAPLAPDDTVREMRLLPDGRLLVSSASGNGLCHVAVMNVDEPSDHWSVEVDGVTTKAMVVAEDDVYFLAGVNDVRRLSLTSRTLSRVRLDGLDLGEVWGIGWLEGRLHAVSSYGFVAHIDPVELTWTTTDLIAVGAPAGAQLGMSVGVGAGFAYVGANGAFAKHALVDGHTTVFPVPGESKAQVVVDGTVYMGQYSSQGVWGYDPTSMTAPAQLALLPTVQNRPQAIAWDSRNERVIVGTQSDSQGGGCVGVYDPRTRDIVVHTNPLDDHQMVSAVVCKDGIAYIGGFNEQTEGPRSEIAALDPMTGDVLWRLDPRHDGGVVDFAILGDHLYVILRNGGLRVVHLRKKTIIHSADVSVFSTNWSSLVVSGGRVHGVSSVALYRLDPSTFEPTLLLSDLAGGWYGGVSKVAADEQGALYTLKNRNLVKISVPQYPHVDATVECRKTGNHGMLVVTARNTENLPLEIVVTSPCGKTRRYRLAAGESRIVRFSVRRPYVSHGEVAIDATANVAGTRISRTVTVEYGN